MVQGSGSIQLALVMVLADSWLGGWVFPAQASPELQPTAERGEGDRVGIPPAPERPEAGSILVKGITDYRAAVPGSESRPATTLEEWQTQIDAAIDPGAPLSVIGTVSVEF